MKNQMSYKESIRRQNYRDKRDEVIWNKICKHDSHDKFECTDEDIVNLD